MHPTDFTAHRKVRRGRRVRVQVKATPDPFRCACPPCIPLRASCGACGDPEAFIFDGEVICPTCIEFTTDPDDAA